MAGIAFLYEMASAGDEVGEGVGLLFALAIFVPVPALFLAAANVRDGIDEAAIDKRQDVGAERGGNGDAVGAVAIEQAGRRAVELEVLAVHERDRNQFAIRGRGHETARDVILGVVAGGHLLRL